MDDGEGRTSGEIHPSKEGSNEMKEHVMKESDSKGNDRLLEHGAAASVMALQETIAMRPAIVKSPAVKKKRAALTHYEKMTFQVLLYSWGLLAVVIYGVHFGNYDLETKTSSKSPTHASFYEVNTDISK